MKTQAPIALGERLNALQDGVIRLLTERIESGEASPGDLSTAVRLLKDHGVSSEVSGNDEFQRLMDTMGPSDTVSAEALVEEMRDL